jgi:hypothetical protein
MKKQIEDIMNLCLTLGAQTILEAHNGVHIWDKMQSYGIEIRESGTDGVYLYRRLMRKSHGSEWGILESDFNAVAWICFGERFQYLEDLCGRDEIPSPMICGGFISDNSGASLSWEVALVKGKPVWGIRNTDANSLVFEFPNPNYDEFEKLMHMFKSYGR